MTSLNLDYEKTKLSKSTNQSDRLLQKHLAIDTLDQKKFSNVKRNAHAHL